MSLLRRDLHHISCHMTSETLIYNLFYIHTLTYSSSLFVFLVVSIQLKLKILNKSYFQIT